MQWLNEPASWQRNGDVLRVSVDPGTDFWRTTGYGYVHDNGHVYGAVLPGDLDVSVRVRGTFANQYDQAGIMLRADDQTWLKAGLEFFEGRPRLSTVLTLGRSSWMVADLPPDTDELTLRLSRRGDAVEIRYAAGDGGAELAALVFMPPDREMLAGIVCAAPEGTGFSVAFHDLRVVGRDWAAQEPAGSADWAGEPAPPAAGWAEEQAAGSGASWADHAAGWGDEQADDGAAGWAGDKQPGEAPPSWADDRPAATASAWGGDKPGDEAPAWDAGKPGATASAWGGDKPGDEAPAWARDKTGESAPAWDAGKPGEAAAGRGGRDRPGKPAAEDTSAGLPPGWGDELPANESLDWAKPQASEPAEDWDRLSLSVSTTWNAFAAAEPAKEQPKKPAKKQPAEQAEKPAADRAAGQARQADRAAGQARQADRAAGQARQAGQAGRDSEDSTGELPASPADDKTDPALPAASPPSDTAEADEPKPRGRNGRGRDKAKLPAPRSPVPSAPVDPADEWISLLTADTVEELSGPAVELSGSEANPAGPEPGQAPTGPDTAATGPGQE